MLDGYTFSYIDNDTPKIYDVSPSTSIANDYLHFYGQHKIIHSSADPLDFQDVIGFRVGG